jgi:DNA-binding Xre family transcriptional regulator
MSDKKKKENKPVEIKTKLGHVLVEVNLLQKELAPKAGLALSTTSEIVSGKLKDYRLSTLYKICKATGKTPNDILDYENEIKQ